MKKLKSRDERQARCRRDRRRRLHRQPYGRSAARARLSRAGRRQSRRRPRSAISRITARNPRSVGSSGAISARLLPTIRSLRGRALRLPFRRHRRHRALDRAADRIHGRQRPGHGARARMRARTRASGSWSTPPRPPATAWPPRRRAKIIRSTPQYPYALSKYQGEQAAFHWHKVYRLPVNSIRIFNAYGTRVRTTGAYGAVFGVFFKQKLAGKPFTVVGDGTQRRDFLYVTRRRGGLPAPPPRPTRPAKI